MRIDEKGQSKVAIIDKDEISIENIQDALDLMGNAQYNDCSKVLIYKEVLEEKFFDLKTRFAGEILQKFMNYNMKIAIVGDFSLYKSKSSKDFIYECNNGKHIFFKDTLEEGLKCLHEV